MKLPIRLHPIDLLILKGLGRLARSPRDSKDVRFTPDEVILFSGGLDSFAGTVEELVAHRKKVALVFSGMGAGLARA